MLRGLYSSLTEGDIVLADRYFSGWCDIALLGQRGIDVVLRKHQLRATDFRTGKRLGKDDHLVSWTRPQRPRWMTAEQYATLPEVLTLREIRIRVAHKGLRTKSLVVVTTLLDAEKYTREEIALLYRRRWQAELHLRSLKVVLQMGAVLPFGQKPADNRDFERRRAFRYRCDSDRNFRKRKGASGFSGAEGL